MLLVFVDTAAWLALVNTRDALYAPARRVMDELNQQSARLITSEFVLIEVANAFSAPAFRTRAVTLIEGLRLLPNLNIAPVTAELLAAGWQLYRNRPDKEWSLTDCTSFIVMKQENVTQAFTSDHHFEQAGFVKLL